jgi:hypothetical protein
MRSVSAFLRGIQNDFILDLNIVPEAGQLFPRRVIDLASFHLAKKPTSGDIVKACEERQCILVTTNTTYEVLLRKNNGCHAALNSVLPHIRCRLGIEDLPRENSCFEEFEARSAIHLALDCF